MMDSTPAEIPVPHTPEAITNVKGIDICHDSFGYPGAPPLLLIMGLGAQMLLWDDAFCAALAARGFHVIRFDNRDIGRSSYLNGVAKIDLQELLMKQISGEPITSPYTLRDMAGDAAGLLTALGIPAAHIVGASMGGMIAQEMAINFPDRVLSLTSIMSTTGDPSLPPPAPEALQVLMVPPSLSREDYIESFCRGWRVFRVGSFPEDEALDPARAGRFWDRGLNPAGVARQFLAIFASGDRTEKLKTLQIPALVIHGKVDPLVPIEAGQATAAAIPGAKFLEISRMGHALPQAIWPEIIDAIATHARP